MTGRAMIPHTVPAPGGAGRATLGCWRQRAHLAVRVPSDVLTVPVCTVCERPLRRWQLCWADTPTLTVPLCAGCHAGLCGHVDADLDVPLPPVDDGQLPGQVDLFDVLDGAP